LTFVSFSWSLGFLGTTHFHIYHPFYLKIEGLLTLLSLVLIISLGTEKAVDFAFSSAMCTESIF